MRKHARWMAASFAAPAIVLGVATWQAWAGKPGGGPPPATGKIAFQIGNSDNPDNSNWEMNADGTGKVNVAPGLGEFPLYNPLGGRPSAKNYPEAGGRWFLKTEGSDKELVADFPDGTQTTFMGRELFAYGWINGVFKRVQLTSIASQGYFDTFEHPDDGVWSNDGQDTFISIKPSRFQVNPETGHIVFQEVVPKHIVRLRISGVDVGNIARLGQAPITSDDNTRFEIVMTRNPGDAPRGLSGSTFQFHHWDPSGTRLLYTDDDPVTGSGVYLRNLTNQSDAFLGPFSGHFRWSPAVGHDKIVVSDGGAIWTINANGTGLFKVLGGSLKWYQYPFFSPDGQWIVYRGSAWSGMKEASWIARIPTKGGTAVPLTSDINNFEGKKYPEGWFAE